MPAIVLDRTSIINQFRRRVATRETPGDENQQQSSIGNSSSDQDVGLTLIPLGWGEASRRIAWIRHAN
jgi:hypothetical protein